MPSDSAAQILVAAGLDHHQAGRHAEAEALVEKAHQVCPYSNATRGNVDVRLSVV